MYPPELIERFWSRVAKCFHGDGCQQCCWEWQAHCLPKGYGTFAHKRAGTPSGWGYAHRFSWSLHHGDIPLGGMILHQCDNPPCVNPAHLRLGTCRDNVRDAQAKGRLMAGDRHYLKLHPEKIGYGEDAPNSTLTTEIVIAIRQRYAEGWPQKQIAKQFNLATSTIYKIVHRQRWPHLPGGDAQATTVICPHCGKELSRRFGNDQRHIQSCGYGEGR